MQETGGTLWWSNVGELECRKGLDFLFYTAERLIRAADNNSEITTMTILRNVSLFLRVSGPRGSILTLRYSILSGVQDHTNAMEQLPYVVWLADKPSSAC